MSFNFSDPMVIDFCLSQKENESPKLYITQHKNDEVLETIVWDNIFNGQKTNIQIKDHTQIVEYTMSFSENYPVTKKPFTYGNPDKVETFLEDTEYLFHFNRETQKIELSHLIKGQKTHTFDTILSIASHIQERDNLDIYVHADWIYEENITIDLMPYIGTHIDTYTPLRGFEKSEDLDIKGPFEGGAFVKKVRYKGPFYHNIVQKNSIHETLLLKINHKAQQTKTLSFQIPDAYGLTFLDTKEGEPWLSYIKKMIQRIDLLQSRLERITIQIPHFTDITLDDNIQLSETKIAKVISYTITSTVTTIVCVCALPSLPIESSPLERRIEGKEWAVNILIKNDASEQELFMETHPITSLDQLPKTQLNVMVG
jgi:hypothetical protein